MGINIGIMLYPKLYLICNVLYALNNAIKKTLLNQTLILLTLKNEDSILKFNHSVRLKELLQAKSNKHNLYILQEYIDTTATITRHQN
jgi:predicted esterase